MTDKILMLRFVFSMTLIFPTLVFALSEFDMKVIKKYMVNLDFGLEDEGDESVSKLLKLEQDDLYFKDQQRNTLKWGQVKEKQWLSFKVWKDERKLKDQNVAWRNEVRASGHDAIIGKVIKCIGVCHTYRGVKKVSVEFQSLIKEGDEFSTDRDSYAWIFLVNGSLVRVAPNTSLSLLEINFTRKDDFIMMRLNNGYMNYLPRSSHQLKVEEKVETDLGFSPLQIKKANREYYMMKAFRKLTRAERFKFTIGASPGAKEQYLALNELIKKNNESLSNRETKVFIFTPNFSLEGSKGQAHLFYEPNGKGFFYLSPKDATSGENTDIVVGKRGYNNTSSFTPKWNIWYEVDSYGKEIGPKQGEFSLLKGSLGFLKRIPSLLLVRELWIEKKLRPMLTGDMDEKQVAKRFGYRLWNTKDKFELQKRVNFAREFTRRVETTNLEALKKIFAKDKPEEFSLKFIRKPLIDHYKQLKKRYNPERSKIFTFTDTEYYLWLITNDNNRI